MIKPVKRIPLSEKDRTALEAIRRTRAVEQKAQPDHYRSKVVVKPWGNEFLCFENESVAIWFLSIKKDHATSMHCHPGKKTSLTLLSGKALCNTFHHRNFLSAGDSLVVEAGVFHSTKAVSLEGISLIEVETPPAKLDLVRLEDNYGRENRGYEGLSQMMTGDLANYRYFQLKDHDCHGDRYVLDNRFSLCMEGYHDPEAFASSFALDPGALYCACRGELRGPGGETVLGVGETERGAFLKEAGKLAVGGDTVLMKITVFH